MEEIKVGEFVRNKYGIAKVINIEEQDGMQIVIFDRNIVYMVNVKTGEIKDYNLTNKLPVTHNIDFSKIKHSFNIIDLVEVGDYVNGKEVKHIADFEGVKEPIRKLIFVDEHRLVPGETAKNDEIKSIVTKEMIKSVEYRLED